MFIYWIHTTAKILTIKDEKSFSPVSKATEAEYNGPFDLAKEEFHVPHVLLTNSSGCPAARLPSRLGPERG